MQLLNIFLNLKTYGKVIFSFALFAPLPLIILTYPIIYMREQRKNNLLFSAVKSKIKNLDKLSIDDLKGIFPGKNFNELLDIHDLVMEKIHGNI
jgi:hypothetical protein